jgi:hypothetical protein
MLDASRNVEVPERLAGDLFHHHEIFLDFIADCNVHFCAASPSGEFYP